MHQQPLTSKNGWAITFLGIGLISFLAPFLLMFHYHSWFEWVFYFLLILPVPVGILNLVAGVLFNRQLKKGAIRIQRGWTALNIFVGVLNLLLGGAAWALKMNIVYIPT